MAEAANPVTESLDALVESALSIGYGHAIGDVVTAIADLSKSVDADPFFLERLLNELERLNKEGARAHAHNR